MAPPKPPSTLQQANMQNSPSSPSAYVTNADLDQMNKKRKSETPFYMLEHPANPTPTNKDQMELLLLWNLQTAKTRDTL